MWGILLIVMVVIALALVVGILADGSSRREVLGLTYVPIDFNNLQDGVYVGGYQGNKSHLRDAEVEVTVQDGLVSGVTIRKGAIDKNGMPVKLTGKRSIDEVFATVLQEKTLDVDVISGATITTKAHLKALEQALVQAQK